MEIIKKKVKINEKFIFNNIKHFCYIFIPYNNL